MFGLARCRSHDILWQVQMQTLDVFLMCIPFLPRFARILDRHDLLHHCPHFVFRLWLAVNHFGKLCWIQRQHGRIAHRCQCQKLHCSVPKRRNRRLDERSRPGQHQRYQQLEELIDKLQSVQHFKPNCHNHLHPDNYYHLYPRLRLRSYPRCYWQWLNRSFGFPDKIPRLRCLHCHSFRLMGRVIVKHLLYIMLIVRFSSKCNRNNMYLKGSNWDQSKPSRLCGLYWYIYYFDQILQWYGSRSIKNQFRPQICCSCIIMSSSFHYRLR